MPGIQRQPADSPAKSLTASGPAEDHAHHFVLSVPPTPTAEVPPGTMWHGCMAWRGWHVPEPEAKGVGNLRQRPKPHASQLWLR